jgi:hypothetical protein
LIDLKTCPEVLTFSMLYFLRGKSFPELSFISLSNVSSPENVAGQVPRKVLQRAFAETVHPANPRFLRRGEHTDFLSLNHQNELDSRKLSR